MERPEGKIEIPTYFDKTREANLFKVTPYNVLIGRKIVIHSRFKQIYVSDKVDPDREYNHILTVLSIVNTLPLPELSVSLYLYHDKNTGLDIPVGYAYYHK